MQFLTDQLMETLASWVSGLWNFEHSNWTVQDAEDAAGIKPMFNSNDFHMCVCNYDYKHQKQWLVR